MENDILHILIVEDEEAHVAAIRRAFDSSRRPTELCVAATLGEYRRQVQRTPPTIALIDLNLPDGSAVEALTSPPENGDFPILVMTSYGNEHIAVQAIKSGALDYIVKSPQSFAEMPRAVERALREWKLLQERRQMQEIMLANEKMAALGTLAAGIAHEINSPLQIITGTSENLIRQIAAGNPPDAARLQAKLENVHRSAWSVAEIVRSLLAYAHPSSQKFGTHDLNHIVHDTLLLIEHQLRSWSSVFVRSDLASDLPPLYCDRNQISQALINLLTNARDAMPGGGQIVVRTRFDSEHRRVALEVSDQGCGIPPSLQKRIFDPFFTTKEVGKGTGLGLSIVAGIVRLHGGEIEVHSQEGMGSTFTLWFPLERPSEEENPSEIGRY